MKRIPGRSQRIVAPEALLADEHQPGLAEIRQMPRRLGLRDGQNFHHVANAKLAANQHVQDAQPGPVGKCPEHQINSILDPLDLHTPMRI